MPSTTSTEVKFSCGQCGRAFRWKPEIAGKQAKCKCGATVTVPRTPPPPPTALPQLPPLPPLPKEEPAGMDGLDGLYALAAEEQRATPVADQYRCPSCGTGVPVGAATCPGCGMELSTGRKPAKRSATAGAGAATAAPGAAKGAGGSRALAVAATALATTGKVIDTAYTIQLWIRRIVLAAVILIVVGFIIFAKIRSWTRGGSDYASDDFGDVRPMTPADERRAMDEAAAETLKEENAIEARVWLKKGERVVFNLGKEKTASTVEELYRIGATKVTAVGFVDDSDMMATVLVIELPANPAARKKLFDWADRTEKKLANDGGYDHERTKDVGQKYLEINFDNT